MTAIIPFCAATLATGCAWILHRTLKKRGTVIPWIMVYLTFILPFAAGGFYTYTAAITTVLLLANLALLVRNQKMFRFCWNLNSASVIAVVIGYCITPIWAIDKGMSIFGIVRYLPLLLLALTLMQYSAEQKSCLLHLIPLCGAVMTIVSLLLLMIPGTDAIVSYRGRLCGFLQYPNTFAAFLLAGLVIQGSRNVHSKQDLIMNAILILGIVLSGSRTGLILLFPALIGIVIVRRNIKMIFLLMFFTVCGLMIALLISGGDLLRNADRFTTISWNSKSLMLRLLYFKDSLPVILKHPFGLGYMGYRALQGSFQTGNYSVTFVHNGLLQLLLDIGWIPSILLTAAFLRPQFSPSTPKGTRLLLLIVLGHCMMDFDLQFFVTWVVLLCMLDFNSGKELPCKFCTIPCMITGVCIAAGCIWLGLGDLCYSIGYPTASLRVTPFHTDALTTTLASSATTGEAAELADRILELNDSCSIAYSAKANEALSQGKILAMTEYKEQAIRTARYSVAEYCDYFDKLYAALQLYQRAGDSSSAAYCLEKLLSIPDMMEQVPTAGAIFASATDSNKLMLPDPYQTILDTLAPSQNT